MDLVIKGKVFQKNRFKKCSIGIKEGKIEKIDTNLDGDKKIDFGDKLILPSGIDLHVHFREPGQKYKEDLKTGSKAALNGGITCFFDMPNTIPQTVNYDLLENKIKLAEKKSCIDFGFYGGITDDNLDNLKEMAPKCSGYKIYLGSSTNSLLFSMENFSEMYKKIKGYNKPVFFHAEDNRCLIKNSKKSIKNLYEHMDSRPKICELKPVKDIVKKTRGLKNHFHICHVSSDESIDFVKKNKPENISYGVTPHHSLFSIEDELTPEGLYKVNPPIRKSSNKKVLFHFLKTGEKVVLESDHAPHSLDEKKIDFNDVPSGIPGVETMYPIFLSLAKNGVISFSRVVSLLCKKPAEIMDLNKGEIKKGKDADLIVVDLESEKNIEASDLHYKCGWTPFEGFKAVFPETVFLRGKKILEKGKYIGFSKGRHVLDFS
ncbi:MAG: dihydroorotase [Candidatus Thermoplasmatota archaeon]